MSIFKGWGADTKERMHTKSTKEIKISNVVTQIGTSDSLSTSNGIKQSQAWIIVLAAAAFFVVIAAFGVPSSNLTLVRGRVQEVSVVHGNTVVSIAPENTLPGEHLTKEYVLLGAGHDIRQHDFAEMELICTETPGGARGPCSLQGIRIVDPRYREK